MLLGGWWLVVAVDAMEMSGRWETRRPMRRLLISHHDTTEFLSLGYMRDLWYCAGWGGPHQLWRGPMRDP